MRKYTRTKSREIALQSLYRIEMSGERIQSVMRDLEERYPDMPEKEKKYIEDILRGVSENKEEIDSLINSVLEHWRPERVNLIDRCILRLGIYEMKYRNDIPHAVAINEAVELARSYGDAKAPAFVNGILDSVRQIISGDKK